MLGNACTQQPICLIYSLFSCFLSWHYLLFTLLTFRIFFNSIEHYRRLSKLRIYFHMAKLSFLHIFQGLHEKNRSHVIGYSLEYSIRATQPMYIYDLFQAGIVFTALIAGFICLSNLVFVTGGRCKNFDLLFSTLAVGFLHLLTCILMLKISEDSAISEIPRGGNQHCVDYFLPATISNTLVLVTISLNIIDRNMTSCIHKLFSKAVFLTCIGTGVYLLFTDSQKLGNNQLHQEVFLTMDTKKREQINFFWSVCLNSIHGGKNRLFVEYCFIYTPVAVVFIAAWLATYCKTKGKYQIVDPFHNYASTSNVTSVCMSFCPPLGEELLGLG